MAVIYLQNDTISAQQLHWYTRIQPVELGPHLQSDTLKTSFNQSVCQLLFVMLSESDHNQSELDCDCLETSCLPPVDLSNQLTIKVVAQRLRCLFCSYSSATESFLSIQLFNNIINKWWMSISWMNGWLLIKKQKQIVIHKYFEFCLVNNCDTHHRYRNNYKFKCCACTE